MHELSIAMNIVELARAEAERMEASVEAVHLRIGALSGVAREALLSCYEMVVFETPLEGSRLVVEETPVVVYCETCRREQNLDSIQNFLCPLCGEPTPQVVRGREMEVVALEILQ